MTSKNARDLKVIGHSTQVIVIPHILREGNSDGCRWGHASLAPRPFLHFNVVTVRKRSYGKIIFSQACVKSSVHRGGGGPTSVHAGIHTPLDRSPMGRHPHGQTHTPARHTPSRRLLQRTVRILLECILVFIKNYAK